MNATVDELTKLVEDATAHDVALVARLKAEIARLQTADKLLERTWMWPKERIDQTTLEQDVWAYFGRSRP